MENKIKHLDLIENVIERMGNNSFHLKGWGLTLVAIIGSLASQGSDKRFIVLAFIPLLAFWFLDSFYLQLERKYKVLYKNIRNKSEEQIDFNMDSRDIVAKGEDLERLCYAKCLFSATEILFYIPIGLAIAALLIILKVF